MLIDTEIEQHFSRARCAASYIPSQFKLCGIGEMWREIHDSTFGRRVSCDHESLIIVADYLFVARLDHHARAVERIVERETTFGEIRHAPGVSDERRWRQNTCRPKRSPNELSELAVERPIGHYVQHDRLVFLNLRQLLVVYRRRQNITVDSDLVSLHIR